MVDKQPLQIQAYDYLVEMIQENKFEPKLLYSETQVAEMLQISRTPVHSALVQLQVDGYIDIYPSRGFKLRPITETALNEAFQRIIALEGFAAYSLLKDFNKLASVIRELNESIDRQAEFAASQNTQGFMEEDRQFHGLIIHSLNNSGFNKDFVIYRYIIRDYLVKSFSRPGGLARSLGDHRQIVQAIVAKDKLILELLERHHNDFQ